MFAPALIRIFSTLVQVICPYSRCFRKEENHDMEVTTATIRQARWFAGRRRARFRRWVSWLPAVPVFLNASLGYHSAPFIKKILRRRIGYRSCDVLLRLSSGSSMMQFDRCAIRVVDRNSEIQVWRRRLRTVRDSDCASEDSGRYCTIANPCCAAECASSYWRGYTRCSTALPQERH
jgi:hypothetical protein